MINLIKNELIKKFHKKGIYIYALIVMVFTIFTSLLNNILYDTNDDSSFYEQRIAGIESNLNGYDLNNTDEARWYAEDKAYLEVLKLQRNYEYSSIEYYFIDNQISSILNEMYYAKYVSQNDSEYEYYKELYDGYLKKLDTYDWKKELESEKKSIIDEINELQNSILVSGRTGEIELEIKNLNVELDCVNYRLDLEIPYSYSEMSNLVDEYRTSALKYLTYNKDESAYKNRSEYIEKKEAEENYYLAKYKLENKIFNQDDFNLYEMISVEFKYVNFILVIGLVIICGGVIADEFNKGTIKQLLVRPFSRNKILLSKFVASFIAFLLFLLFYLIAISVSLTISYNDFYSLFGNIAVYNFNSGSVIEINFILYCLLLIVSVLPAYFIIFLVIMLVGVLSTNTVGTICAGLGISLLPDMLEYILPSDIKAYLPFYNWNFSPYLFGGISSNQYSSFGLAVSVCVITIIVLLVVTFVSFNNKDVKNQ